MSIRTFVLQIANADNMLGAEGGALGAQQRICKG